MTWLARLKNLDMPETDATKATKRVSVVSVASNPRESGKNNLPKAAPCDAIGLRARCREACRGLPVSPADLLASLNEADKAAQLSGEEGGAILRAAAECMAERAKPALDAKIERAYQHCREDLKQHPEWNRAIWTVDPDADPVLIAVAVRGVGCATLRIEQARYHGRDFELFELIQRADMPESTGDYLHKEVSA